MKRIALLLTTLFQVGSISCVAQVDSLKDASHKRDWTFSLFLGNAGINKSVIDLAIVGANDSRYYYDVFNTDHVNRYNYSFGFFMESEYRGGVWLIGLEYGKLQRYASQGSRSLSYFEIESLEDYYCTQLGYLRSVDFNKTKLSLGFGAPLLFSNGILLKGHDVERDSASNLILETNDELESPRLLSLGIGPLIKFNLFISSTFSIGAVFGGYFLVTSQDGELKETQSTVFPSNNSSTIVSNKETSSVSFSGIDMKLTLSVKFKTKLK